MTLGTSQENFEIFSGKSKKDKALSHIKRNKTQNPDGTWERHRDYL